MVPLQVFSQNAKFGDIPKSVTVAKRLSQCLHPALPMGEFVVSQFTRINGKENCTHFLKYFSSL